MNEESDNQQLKGLLEKSLKEIESLKRDVGDVKRYMKIRTIITIVWIIVVLAPTIFAILYVPALIRDLVGDGDVFRILGI